MPPVRNAPLNHRLSQLHNILPSISNAPSDHVFILESLNKQHRVTFNPKIFPPPLAISMAVITAIISAKKSVLNANMHREATHDPGVMMFLEIFIFV